MLNFVMVGALNFREILKFLELALFVGAIFLIVIIVKSIVKRKKDLPHVVRMYSGSLGSGKSFLATRNLQKIFRKLNRKYIKARKNGKAALRPVVYSNIPLYLGKGKYSNVLTREHLLLLDTFPEDVIPLVLIDEVGLSANQYSYDDPNIISANINENWRSFEIFIRLFRHFYGDRNADHCRLYVTDQASGGVNINLRRRFGCVEVLSNFQRLFKILPFYHIDVSEMVIQEDQTVTLQHTDKDGKLIQEYYLGFLPYKWMQKIDRFKRCYDSHCYSGVKYSGFSKTINFKNWKNNDYSYVNSKGEIIISKLKTNYCPDLRMSEEEKIRQKARLANMLNQAKKELAN